MTPGPTYREATKALREQREAHTRALVAEWRAKNPSATCSDAVALTLAELQRDFGGGAR